MILGIDIVFMFAPPVPLWGKLVFLVFSLLFPFLAWRVYVHNYNTIRRNMGLSEWDWDWGGPKQDNHDSVKAVKKTSATEKK